MQDREDLAMTENLEQNDMALEELVLPYHRFVSVEALGLFGRRLDHNSLFAELQRQKDNRRDYLFEPRQGRFVGTKFQVGNRVYPLDDVSLSTLAERFKVNGGHTVTRNGLAELSRNENLFQEVANYFLHSMDKPLQFRTLYDVGIAFPSQQYTIVNHFELLQMICDTLSEVFEERATTHTNYLSKELLYSFIPIPDCVRTARYLSEFEDQISLGLEVRNSEILHNGIVVNFKIVRNLSSAGFILGEHISHVYQKHINLTTEEAINKVREGMLFMFQDEGLPLALTAMDNLIQLMNTEVRNGEDVAREFASIINLTESETENLIRVGNIQNDQTLYGWTIGALSYIANSRNNRNKQELEERLVGRFLIDEEKFNNLMRLSY